LEAGYLLGDLSDAGFSIKELGLAGFSPEELRENGFSAQKLIEAGLLYSLAQLISGHYSAKELQEAGFSPRSLKGVFPLRDLRRAGFSYMDMKEAGISDSALRCAGFCFFIREESPEEMENPDSEEREDFTEKSTQTCVEEVEASDSGKPAGLQLKG